MDVLALAELFVVGWVGALTALGFTGVAKYIWNIIATSTEESLVEARVIDTLDEEKK